MNGKLLARPEEVRSRAERVGEDERLALGPPERRLSPHRQIRGPEDVERRTSRAHDRSVVQRDAEAPCERGAVAPVPVEELNDAYELPERPDSLIELRYIDRIDQPHAPAFGKSMRRTLQVSRLVGDPAEAERKLVAEARGHQGGLPGWSSIQSVGIARRHLMGAKRSLRDGSRARTPQPLATVTVMLHAWDTTEQVLDSGGFESTQRVLASLPVVESSSSGARWLGVAYWQAVGGFTRGGIRARWTDDGGRLTLLGGVSLLAFGPPELAFSDDLVSCRYPIQGGLLAVRAGGSVTLAQRRIGAEFELSVVVQEYLPRLAARAGTPRWTGALYAKGQSPFHAAISRRYFDLLVRRAAR